MFCAPVMVYGEPGACVTLLDVTVYTNNFPALWLIA